MRSAVLAVLGLIVACGGGVGLPAAGNEAQKREAASVPYVDPHYHYRIDAPGQMTLLSNGTASFVGVSERLEVAIIERATAVDPSAAARKDSTSLASSLADFHLLSRPAVITLAGHAMVKFVYTWTATSSDGTGERLKLTSVRYYVPKNLSVVAVLTYGMSTDEFDPSSADAVASTFSWQ
jgi:hypothetical protein